MDRKKLWEIACAAALVVTMGFYMLADSPMGLTNWWGVVFSPLCASGVSDPSNRILLCSFCTEPVNGATIWIWQ